jgi:hypothetical protein
MDFSACPLHADCGLQRYPKPQHRRLYAIGHLRNLRRGFSEKDIVAKITFDERPSAANNQKRAFMQQVDTFVNSVKESPYTDISGGILQAIEYLNEAGSGKRYILIFSDLKEELAKGYKRDIPFQLKDFSVIALNVTKLRGDNIDPKEYMARLEDWRAKVESGGGQWGMINDLERLDNLFTNRY